MILVFGLRRFFAVDDEGALHLFGLERTRQQINHLAIVAVSGEALDLGDLRLDLMIKAKDGYPLAVGILDACAERGRRTVTYDKDRALGIGDVIGHVVLDATCLQHTAGRDDDTGIGIGIEAFGFVDIRDIMQGIEAKGIGVESHRLADVFVEFVGVHAEDLRGVEAERRIDIDGYMRQGTVVVELVEHIDNLLRTADRETRDNEFAFLIDAGVVHYAKQFLFGHERVFVQAVTVGRLADEVVTLRDELGRRQDMTMQPSEVAGESDALADFGFGIGFFLIDLEVDDGRTEHMTGVGEGEEDIVEDAETAVVVHRDEQFHRVLHMVGVVERRDLRLMEAVHLLVVPLDILRLDKGRILQHECTEVARGRRAVDIAAESLSPEIGNQTAVVNVRVGEDDTIDLLRIETQVAVVALRFLTLTLIQTAVQQDAFARTGRDKMLATGYFAGGAEKLNRHKACIFSIRGHKITKKFGNMQIIL